MNDPLPIALELMGVESTSGNEAGVIALVERMMASRGWKTSRIPVTPGRDDLLAVSGDKPVVAFSTHLDTVPPYIAPSVDGELLKGRGACDAKGVAAALICAAEALRAKGTSVALLFVIGEETTHDGATAANKVPIGTRVLINGEPTESTLGLGTKGAVKFTVRTTGKAAHSAYPHLGKSATADLVALLAELDDLTLPTDDVLGETTVNIGKLSGGVADNVTAPSAEARLMVRLVRPAAETLAVFRTWAAGRAELITNGDGVPPVHLPPLAGFPASVVAYATDVPNLTTWGVPYLFGPGSIHVAHTDEEHIRIRELRSAVDTYERLALAALNSTGGSA